VDKILNDAKPADQPIESPTQSSTSSSTSSTVAEPKLDGQRAQVHIREGRTVACYWRPGRDLLHHPGMGLAPGYVLASTGRRVEP
jgi:ATP-dependent DNA ligase